MEYIFNYIDLQGAEWNTFKFQVMSKISHKFEDL